MTGHSTAYPICGQSRRDAISSNPLRLRRVLKVAALAFLVTTPTFAEPYYYGRVTSLDGTNWWMETPGGPNGRGSLIDTPDFVEHLKGRKGQYQIRYLGKKAEPSEVQAWAPALCAPMNRTLAAIQFRKKSNRLMIAEVQCSP